jgi:two-component system OmpR family sensor kinase
MFRRRLSFVLGLVATVVVMAALLAAASLKVIERQVERGRVASDIATGFIQLSAQKQRLRTWVAQVQQGAQADLAGRAELLAALQGTLAQLDVLVLRAIALDGGSAAREEHVRRTEALAVLQRSVSALARAVEEVRPLAPGADARAAWEAQSGVFDLAEGYDLRRLIADNIARETAAVQRERAAADATLAAVRGAWLGVAALLALSTLGALLYFGRALRHPLQLLSEGAGALQAGRLGHRIPLAGRDEFSAVAASVNALAQELEQHRTREAAQRQLLEEQVAARTAELADALSSLREADVRRRRLFADISHELRTPTTVIRGEAEITLRGVDKPPSEYRQTLSRIVDTARQLGAVIDDLLAMARSDIDALSLARGPVDLDELVRESIAQAAPQAQAKEVRLLGPGRPACPHVVHGDPLRLRQLLGILLDNATRYSRPGGSVTVSLDTEDGDGVAGRRVVLAVADQGIGIPPHELPQVFERGFRGERARHHHAEGSGLGLGIARSLAQAHGGGLVLESLPAGTRAVLSLPLARAPVVVPA